MKGLLFLLVILTGIVTGCSGNIQYLGTNEFLFSGYVWQIKEYEGSTAGPGPNYFSGNSNDIRVDGSGYLHMKVTNRSGKWYSTEVISKQSFGYGTYVFYLGSRGDTLDRMLVLGLFTWDDNSNAQINSWNEIDFEFSRWNNATNFDFQFVVQPWNWTSSNIHRFEIDNSTQSNTVHSFKWTSKSIVFTSAYGSTYPANPADVINSWTYYGPCNPVPGQEKVHINLWQILGNPPVNGIGGEMVIKKFEFYP